MKSVLMALIRAIGRLARDEASGELLSTRLKSQRLKAILSGRND